jgi:hypothetical protein
VFVKASSDRVGIGTSSPNAKLDVNGNTVVTGNLTVIGTISASNYLGVSGGSATPGGTNQTIQFNSGSTFSGSSNLVWDYTNQRLGIGTSSANSTLDVAGEIRGQSVWIVPASGVGNKGYLTFNARTNPGDNNNNVAQFVSDAGTDSSNASFALNMIDADASGWDTGFVFKPSPAGDDFTYVGIGTSNPAVRLDVVGNGTTAAKFSSGSVIITGNLTVTGSIFVSGSSIYGQVAELTSSTTNYTLVRQDSGKFLNVNSGSAVTITVPTGLPTGFTVSLCQLGAGQVTVTGAVGVTINNRQSHTKTAGQYSVASLVGTSANTYVFVGDTST